jgi:membrane protein implicated in regulation of membrane protease activity
MEVRVSRDEKVGEILAKCERYWLETNVPRRAVTEMRAELEQHLEEARLEGKSPASVVGEDLAAFAEAWASEQRDRWTSTIPTWEDVNSGRTSRRRRARWYGLAYVTVVVAVVAVAAATDGGGNEMENEVWRWLWTGLAVVMSIGEMFTAGFFLLPFGIGAAAAAVLAWLDVSILAQWIVFFVVSGVSLWYVRRFMHHQDEGEVAPIGANRYLHSPAVVLETIDPAHGTGMVRVESEQWRATSRGEIIEEGTRVTVMGMSGAKLVVAESEQS